MEVKQDSKRRISSGAPLLAISEEDLVEAAPSKKKLSGRRKSSLVPNNPQQTNAKKENLVEMYSRIIKLSTENKITAKNSWELDIEALVNDIMTPQEKEAHRRESKNKFSATNFQRASCGIDASVKIYSCRVDDTWSSSYRVLNHIAGNAKELIEEVDETEEDPENKDNDEDKPKKTKTKKQRNNNSEDYTKTIAKNVASISMGTSDKQGNCGSDLIACSRLSRMIESGSRQLILNSLAIADNCCALTLESGNKVLDASSQRFQPNIEAQALALKEKQAQRSHTESLCKYLTSKRDERLGKAAKQVQSDFNNEIKAVQSKLLTIEYKPRLIIEVIDVPVEVVSQSTVELCDVINNMPQDDNYNDYDDVACPETYVDKKKSIDSQQSASHTVTSLTSKTSTSHPTSSSSSSHELLDKVLEQVGSSTSDYAYFDVQNMANMTEWSKIDHWAHAKDLKKKTKRDEMKLLKSLKNDDNDDEESLASVKTKKTRKPKVTIDFSSDAPLEECFQSAKQTKSKRTATDSTQLSSTTIDRLFNQSLSSKPSSSRAVAKFELKDLCTLFCRPQHVVDILQDLSTHEKKQNISLKSIFSGPLSRFSNEVTGRKSLCLTSGHELRQEDDYGNCDDDQGEWIGCDDEAKTEVAVVVPTSEAAIAVINKPTVQDYWNDKLTKRDVLTVAKGPTIINLKKLKKDVWDHVESSLENKTSSTFSSLIKSVSKSQNQKDVSVQFYFITLLHLANERGLSLSEDGCGEMDGFSIGSK